MSDPHQSAGSPTKEDPERLVLRGKPRPVVRFRRGLIVGLTGAEARGHWGPGELAIHEPVLEHRNPQVGLRLPLRIPHGARDDRTAQHLELQISDVLAGAQID